MESRLRVPVRIESRLSVPVQDGVQTGPEIDWHRDRYPRDMINPAERNHVNRQRSPSSNAISVNNLPIITVVTDRSI